MCRAATADTLGVSGHPRGRRIPLALIAALLAVAQAGPASGAPPTTLPPASPGAPPPEASDPGPPPPVLAPPGADEAGRDRARAELRAAGVELRRARAQARAASRAVAPHRTRLAEAEAVLGRLDGEERQATETLSGARARVRRLAVAGYVGGGDAVRVDYLLRASSADDLARRRSLVQSATEAGQGTVDAYAEALRAVSEAQAQALAAADAARATLGQAEAEAADRASRVSQLEAEVDLRRQLLDVVTAAAPALPSDIPRLFLDAYRAAAAAMAKKTPGCRVPWTALAGIGKIESNHGRYKGAQLALNGDVFPRILGIPLDGTRSRLIRDTDQGEHDTDTTFDRAVGPMQFIPSTWARIGADGNGDGRRDPNNAYDATLSAAAYLCRAVPAGGLDADERLRPAFFSYNHSDAYVELVLAWTHTYRELAATSGF